MRVRMKVDMSGAYNGQAWPRSGGEIDLPDGVGARMCSAGLAMPVADDKIETAKLDDTSEKRRPGRPRKSTQGE